MTLHNLRLTQLQQQPIENPAFEDQIDPLQIDSRPWPDHPTRTISSDQLGSHDASRGPVDAPGHSSHPTPSFYLDGRGAPTRRL
jgi:hypothetical protein